ncbi:Uncharacterised protein [uncultured archaeon]|nr:Uncharacterised protein [uncultured archaeon]
MRIRPWPSSCGWAGHTTATVVFFAFSSTMSPVVAFSFFMATESSLTIPLATSVFNASATFNSICSVMIITVG